MNYIKRIGVLLKKGLPLRIGLMNAVVTGTLIYFFIRFSFTNGIMPFNLSLQSVLEIMFSFITINLLVQIINLATERLRVTRIIMQEILLLILWLTNSYYLKTHVPLDFSLIADNIGLSLSLDSLDIISSSFQLEHVAAALIITAVVAFAEFRFMLISCVRQEKPRHVKTAISFILYAAAVIAPLQSYDQITALMQDAYHRTLPDQRTLNTITGYPYLKETTEISRRFLSSGSRKPDIILVMIESYNANFVEAKTPDGREITPVLNSLIKKGIYYDRFYGNSIQTCKGQAATLLSVLPSIKGKIFTSYPNLRFKALPSYLASAGYDTLFMQASSDLAGDNTARFMKRAGFAEVRSAYEFIRKKDRNFIWGWGPEDRLFYETFLDYLDRRKTETGGKPVFALLATVANHMYFNRVPKRMKMLYPKPVNIEQDYANSIHLSDHQLNDLINLINQRSSLSNTIIIITGDHSFPINEHGCSHNENGYYDESFRIPFLILWKGRLSAQRISDCAYSQVDIAPTIFDLAGIHVGRNSFMGKSLFLKNKVCKPVYLIQPYHGAYLQSIRYPYKYIYHRKSGAEYMFNLGLDPSEKSNIIHQVPAELLTMMRRDIDSIFLNQRILDENVLYKETAE